MQNLILLAFSDSLVSIRLKYHTKFILPEVYTSILVSVRAVCTPVLQITVHFPVMIPITCIAGSVLFLPSSMDFAKFNTFHSSGSRVALRFRQPQVYSQRTQMRCGRAAARARMRARRSPTPTRNGTHAGHADGRCLAGRRATRAAGGGRRGNDRTRYVPPLAGRSSAPPR